MNKEVIKFLNDVKYEYFCFLKENSRNFPKCCVEATLLLQRFLEVYFNESFPAIIADKKYFPNRAKFHTYIEKDEYVIDFTLFQFYIGMNKFKNISNEESYDYSINEIQRGEVIFAKDYYDTMFINKEIYETECFLRHSKEALLDKNLDLTLAPKESFLNYLNECIDLLK